MVRLAMVPTQLLVLRKKWWIDAAAILDISVQLCSVPSLLHYFRAGEQVPHPIARSISLSPMLSLFA